MKNLDLKQRLVTIGVFLLAAAVVGVVVVVSGVVPIKASSGHWEVTKWFLHFSKARSIATHSAGIEAPPLDDPALVLKGAGHYETGCVQCHGSPSRPASPIALSMTGKPPALPPLIAERKPEELFYVVKHGIKFTGMPAWPALERDDEVWAVTAFLLELPAMDAKRYRELTSVPDGSTSQETVAGVSPSTLETCRRCHGGDGLGRDGGAFPKLAGQKREYLLASLEAYAAGHRHSGVMQPVAAPLDPSELSRLADHYADLPGGLSPEPENSTEPEPKSDADADETAAAVARGEEIASKGIPDKNVPSCMDCHGPGGQPRSAKYPRLAGQYADYLALQLQLFKKRARGGTAAAHLMHKVVHGLSDEDLQNVANYYGSRSP